MVCTCSEVLLFLLSYITIIPIVSDLSSSADFGWKAHFGKVYEVQFGSADEEKVYSLGEDGMFFLWDTSRTSAPLRVIRFDNLQLPPQLSWMQKLRVANVHISHPAPGKNKLFGFCFAYKYLLISSVEGKVVYEVKECNLC